MSKSTPISNLPNLKKQSGPAFEQRENEIVKEILNEIDSDKQATPPQPQQPAGPTPEQGPANYNTVQSHPSIVHERNE